MSEAKNEVVMEKDGQKTEVADNGSVEVMEAAGWKRVGADKKPSDGLKVDELKAALTAKGIAFTEGAKKDELAALLDAAG